MPPALLETKRQYRVAKQSLGIHAALRGRYEFLLKSAERLLLLASTCLAVVSLSPTNVLSTIGVGPLEAEFVLAVASIVAVVNSGILTLSDWRDRVSRHQEAVDAWTTVVSSFRRLRTESGKWEPEARSALDDKYWRVASETVEIPDEKFTKYKGKYLRKIATSRLQHRFPGVPHVVLRMIVRLRDVLRLLKLRARGSVE